MKWTILAAAAASLFIVSYDDAQARTRSQRCSDYAYRMTRHAFTTTGPARGAARGALGSAIVGGHPGRGAAIGAGIGTARMANQRARSFNYYYNRCMRGW